MRSQIPVSPVRPGATLLELLAAATVVGLFLTVAAPRVIASPSAADAGAQTVLTGLTRAQRLAVTEQRNVIVTFEIPERALVIHLDADHDGERGPGESVTRLELDEGVEYGPGAATPRPDDDAPVTFRGDPDGRPRVTFRRNGSVSEAGAFYLSVPGGGAGDARLVTVSRASGRGTVHAFSEGEWTPLGRPR